MCSLFGLIDLQNALSVVQKNKLLAELSAACEVRGKDATGIAYNSDGKLYIHKAPLPAHFLRFNLPKDTRVIMGHTRMTTQGDAMHNYNNHPFRGKADIEFALAHNGVLYNDVILRQELHLPATHIETDSYAAVQILEQQKELGFASLRHMSERLEGTFTFTVLDANNNLYFIKGNNPMCIWYYPQTGLYLYASTEEILRQAAKKIPYNLSKHKNIELTDGEILRVDACGKCDRTSFNTAKLEDEYSFMYRWSGCWQYERGLKDWQYVRELKAVASTFGLPASDIDTLLADGFSPEDIEEILYDSCANRVHP